MKKTVTIHELWDDLNPVMRADETVVIGVNGVWYELDLTSNHVREVLHVLSKYTEKGRRVSANRAKAKPDTRTYTGRIDVTERNKNIRAWAKEQPDFKFNRAVVNGVSSGRIPLNIQRAWEEAGSPVRPTP
jgi:Lsr2